MTVVAGPPHVPCHCLHLFAVCAGLRQHAHPEPTLREEVAHRLERLAWRREQLEAVVPPLLLYAAHAAAALHVQPRGV
eukprot:scaffold35936_cov33-Phaeocystis_antarctica.AAC.3